MKRALLALGLLAAFACASASHETLAPAKGKPQPPGMPAQVFLDGQPFPKPVDFEPRFPEPKRTFFISPSAPAGGDGSETHPWSDLQAALTRLQPGDRLVLLPGSYLGQFVIGEPGSSDGSEKEPIQVVGRPGAVLLAHKTSPNAGPVLTVRRAYWRFRDLEISPGQGSRPVGFLTADARDILMDRCHVHDGFKSGILVGSGSQRVTIARCHIHGFRGRKRPHHSHGISVSTVTNDVRIVDNDLHDNGDASIGIEGPHGGGKEMSSLVEKLTIEGNRIHDDDGNGLFVRGAQGVRIAGNVFWKPSIERGAAIESAMQIEVWTNVRDLVVENNRFVGGSAGIVIGKAFEGAEGSVDGPFNVTVRRNLFEGRSEPEAVGIVLGTGVNVRVANNVIERFRTALRALAEPPHSQGTVFANNLILGTGSPAFEAPELSAFEAFDNNFFGVPRGGRLQVSVDGKNIDLSALLAGGSMPGSKLVEGLAFVDHDLARVFGAAVVDAGRPVRGVAHKGKAPDVGVAEK